MKTSGVTAAQALPVQAQALHDHGTWSVNITDQVP
jgi:hypothetical protein